MRQRRFPPTTLTGGPEAAFCAPCKVVSILQIETQAGTCWRQVEPMFDTGENLRQTALCCSMVLILTLCARYAIVRTFRAPGCIVMLEAVRKHRRRTEPNV